MEGTVAACFLTLVLAISLETTSADITIQYAMDEEKEPGYRIGNLVTDSVIGTSYTRSVLDSLQFGMLPGPHINHFRLESTSGVLYVNQSLDRDAISGCSAHCLLNVEAAIVAPIHHFTVIHLEITIVDINDNQPRFSTGEYSLSIPENEPVGSSLMLPTASDPDSLGNSIQDYYLSIPHPLFTLEYIRGVSGPNLILQAALDHETENSYDLQVVAVDGGSPPRSGILTVSIEVTDTNDNSPVFNQPQYNVTILENQEVNRPIITIHATDNDHGINGQIVYSLSQQTLEQFGHIFGLNSQSGDLYLKRIIDYKMGTMYQLVVVAQDQGGGSKKAYATVRVRVEDVNNHEPVITVNSYATGRDIGVSENEPAGSIVAVISVQDLDPGINGRCICEILDSNFELEELYTNGYKVASSREFDRESQAVYQSVIQCHDMGTPSLTSQEQITINIHDVNDNAPEFEVSSSYQVNVQENSTFGDALLRVSATDRDEAGTDNAIIKYSLEPAASTYLEINEDTGVLALKRPLDYEDATFLEYRIMAQDQGFPSKVAQTMIRIDIVDINDEAPVFSQDSYNFGTYENQANVTEIGTISAVDRDSSPYDTFAYSLYGTADILETFSIHSVDGTISTRFSLDREVRSVYTLVVIATDIYPPQHSSSVSVTIYIADKNDNVPVMSFPGEQNNSVEFSTYAPVSSLVSSVHASDLDLGTNAKLTYSLMNYLDLFSIDPVLGNIYVRTPLQNVRETTLDLHIVVSDNGNPSLSATATLRINLNSTMAFAQQQGMLPEEAVSGLSRHEMILVILGSITALLVSLLVVAIILVKRRQLRHSKETFRCMQRVDYSQKMGSQNLPISANANVEAGSLAGSNLWLEKRPAAEGKPPSYREVSYNGDGGSIGNQKVSSVTNPSSHLQPHDYLESLRERENIGSGPRTSSPLSSFVVKANRDVDSDNASRCSAELSNTDSGHGPSEEGDTHETHQPSGHATRHTCPIHGSTDAGSIQSQAGGESSLPHLHGKRRPPSLKSHEQGMAGVHSQNLPGVHGHSSSKPHNNNLAPHINNLNDPRLNRPTSMTAKLNDLTEGPPARPPRTSRPVSNGSFKPPPTDLWVNSNQYNMARTGPGQRSKAVSPSASWVGGSNRLGDESDDDGSSSASSGSFVLNIGEMRSVDV